MVERDRSKNLNLFGKRPSLLLFRRWWRRSSRWRSRRRWAQRRPSLLIRPQPRVFSLIDSSGRCRRLPPLRSTLPHARQWRRRRLRLADLERERFTLKRHRQAPRRSEQ
ncbi:hypothetical protein I3842_12G050400 [Carya illinoinensis]|uniref:Uncharacterized protein n=1 Tax=Carya illinoinensis TaxID=32201 RepID=A0A922DGX2_CARIL|nr:hypothetical protein I3842_12G050400 [Carya illinoinensis]